MKLPYGLQLLWYHTNRDNGITQAVIHSLEKGEGDHVGPSIMSNYFDGPAKYILSGNE